MFRYTIILISTSEMIEEKIEMKEFTKCCKECLNNFHSISLKQECIHKTCVSRFMTLYSIVTTPVQR